MQRPSSFRKVRGIPHKVEVKTLCWTVKKIFFLKNKRQGKREGSVTEIFLWPQKHRLWARLALSLRDPNAGYSHSKLKFLEEKQESNMDCFSSGWFFFSWQESVWCILHIKLSTRSQTGSFRERHTGSNLYVSLQAMGSRTHPVHYHLPDYFLLLAVDGPSMLDHHQSVRYLCLPAGIEFPPQTNKCTNSSLSGYL